MRPAADIATRAQAVFDDIAATRMRDFPLSNPALRVAAVGFCDWDGSSVGVLIAPWSINLLRVPHRLETDPGLQWTLPSGDYTFMPFDDARLPGAQLCSLYSPPAEFSGQDEAEALALGVMAELLRAPAPAEPPRWSRRALLSGAARHA